MPATRTAVPVLVAAMLASGCANSLLSKYQDMQCVKNCGPHAKGQRQDFEQPVWQSLNMFVGEMACLLPVIYQHYRSKSKSSLEYTPLAQDEDPTSPSHKPAAPTPPPMQGLTLGWMFFPALCDILGTTLMNIGLILCPVSIYQMSRGALVLWVGVLSVIFLKRKLFLYQWGSLILVMAGVAVVGLSGTLVKQATSGELDEGAGLVRRLVMVVRDEGGGREDPAKVFIGVLFILFAQVFTASQFVIEEKLMTRYTIEPLLAVGLEGFFGFTTILIAMPILHFFFASRSEYFDVPLGYHQIVDNPIIFALCGAICCSIAVFNVAGLSVTRAVSAAARSTIDTCRTVGIWAVSLFLGWEKLVWPFSLLQISGFIMLVYGTFIFNGLLPPPICQPSAEDLHVALPHEADLERTAILPADQGRSGYDVVPEEEEAPRR